MPVIDNLQVRATGDVAAAERSIDRLIAKLRQLQTVGSQINSTPQSTGESAVAEAVKNYKQLRQTLSKIQKIGHESLFSESAYQQIQHLSMELVDLSYSAQRALVAMDALKESGTMIITPDAIEGLKATVEKLSDSINRLADKKMKAKKAADDMAKSTKKLGNTAKSASGGISKLFAAIKRVVVYRMLRGAIKAITTALREGVENLYQWATANQDAFKQVMDTYATRVNYLKNTLGALAGTILTALLPAFLLITEYVIKGINAVTEFIGSIKGALTGDYSYYRAREVAVEFAEATDDAANAQKKLNQQLMRFDELNVITTPRDNGSKDSNAWQDAFYLANAKDLFGSLNLEGIKGDLQRLGEQLIRPIKFGWDKIQEIFGYIKEKLEPHKDKIEKFVTKVVDLFETINDLAEGITDFVNEFVFIVVDQLDLGAYIDGSGDILTNVKSILNFVKQTLNKLKSSLVFQSIAIMTGQITDIVTKLTIFGTCSALKNIEHLLESIVGFSTFDFASGVKGAIKSLIDIVFGIISLFTTLIDKIQDGLHVIFGMQQQYLTPGLNKAYDDIISYIDNAGIQTGGGASRSFGEPSSKSYGAAAGYFQSESYRRMMEGYASGGYPSMGSVFVAGEIPGQAEMVGNINGRTGVASGEEITGISEAVYSTGGETNALLRELISVAASGNGKPNAAFGKFVSQSLNLYKGVTG